MTRVTAILTAHNRRDKTLACLESLERQVLPDECSLSVILVDDGSSDGTARAVRSRFPRVELLAGSGQLYWNGGMRLAFARAIETNPEYVLWINDDTTLYPTAVAALLATATNALDRTRAVIVVGCTADPVTGATTYGGQERASALRPSRFRLIPASERPQRCETFNGNCVLVSRETIARVGNLEEAFTHAMGDLDYGLRASRAGCECWIAPGHLGTCLLNDNRRGYLDPSLALTERWKHMLGPKGLPIREWKVFTRRHCGLLWPAYWAGVYVSFLARAAFQQITRGRYHRDQRPVTPHPRGSAASER